ncbi:MAG: tRNA preQ1(34) S-adenosylmethionine ribosyltransferase-isomerase QueA, partial [Gammaproteobacteria bacterium]
MRTSDFDFSLPPELIAQEPVDPRPASRLLWLDAARGIVAEGLFRDLARWLRPGDLLVLNDTRVIPARLRGRKASGGRVELLVERVLPGGRELLAQLRASRAPRPGARILLGAQEQAGEVAVEGGAEGGA